MAATAIEDTNVNRLPRLQSGITLLELMIVVAVVSLLAAIAYPSYRDQVIKSHRTEGKAALMETAQALERCFTNNNSFTACGAVTLPFTTRHGRYQITEDQIASSVGTSYRLSAVPQGGQANDARCGTFSLTNTGARQITGSGTVAECW
jgi:type IV pilus assembly protein PilE